MNMQRAEYCAMGRWGAAPLASWLGRIASRALGVVWMRGRVMSLNGGALSQMGSARALAFTMLVVALTLQAQDDPAPEPPTPPSVAQKWDLFNAETVSAVTLGAAAFNAVVSQATNSTPLYGRRALPEALPKRFGASAADITSQNFFGDFVFASAFHEDTRYNRRGASHRMWRRIGYAITRSVVTRTDSGEPIFNWANVVGTGMSTGLANAYYPPGSRGGRAWATNWGVSIADSGFANLMPEFSPDFMRWVKKKLPLPRSMRRQATGILSDSASSK